jgi:EAL domain-containing protein (putative c-di-GMP-specific phosphodiesterase class I)
VILGDRELTVRSSIGIVQAQGHASAEELLRDADTAMYAAKNKKEDRGSHAVFEPGMRDSIVRRLELKTELARAIANSELVLHFQPLVDLPTQTIGGFEALVRWEHATRGLIPPFDFIPLAEETGLIVPLGEWVLREATMRAKQLQEETGRPLYMAINLSARQLLQTDVVGSVSKALLESKMDPADIVLEITETSLMEDAQAGERVLHELRELGVRIAIDDFGTGYSSLSYLKQFPIDILKIDRTFVSSITEGPEESALAEALIHLSRILSLDTVAEGIETSAQLQKLQGLGCAKGQGYLFSKPLPIKEIQDLLRATAASAPAAS